ncbi:LTA synthase family protein [Marinobacter sp. 2_MG-2023]|uniref:LTA synthase family protein n=1 Tax=Marinobacter sp. 2_MG-2023 TaxID=3062679 RepID=UPI0026E3A88C|nr:sulfatase-like hydrolase/transferase [Marinobacter sp. 2_MG-2023]MDO6440661.1 sulfatase-like hydrolase/transferase [Marinobacter sp. 2_MG-2023]
MRLFAILSDRRFLITLGLAWCWLLMIRAALVMQSGVWPSPIGMVGGDLIGALILAILLTMARGPLRIIMVILLGCAVYVAGMHLAAHGTLFQLAFAAKSIDPTFISGSLINAYLALLPFYLFLAWLLHRLHLALVPRPPRGTAGLLALGAGALLVYTAAFPSLTTPANNVVASALAQIPGTVITPLGTAISDEAVEVVGPPPETPETQLNFFHQRVKGAPVDNPPNVLLIMIEGLSAGYFPEISQYHGLQPLVTLENLESTLKAQGFRMYRNHLSLERQTDRGTFSIVCGRYPDFRRVATKLSDVTEERASPDCLPAKLSHTGYHTAYWQAAPTDYMQKDKFMPKAGFLDVTGAEVFDNAEDIEGWGPADPVYFANIAKRLKRLDQRDSPWFVTLLNIGTHHPFDIGEEAEEQLEEARAEDAESSDDTPLLQPQQARRDAMKVMETSLGHFLEELTRNGTLDNTLVILTSDESGGFVRADHETLPLNSNLGMLAVRPPDPRDLAGYANESAITAQLDIPMTVLDATGRGMYAGDMIGRSLLAVNDKEQRDILLADTYTGLKYFFRDRGELLACTELLARCTSWTFDPDRVFGSFKESDSPPFLTLDERLTLFKNATKLTPDD